MDICNRKKGVSDDYMRDTLERYDQSSSSGKWIAAIIALALIAAVAYMLTAATKPDISDATRRGRR